MENRKVAVLMSFTLLWEFCFHVYYDNPVLTEAVTFYLGAPLPSLGPTSAVPTPCLGDILKQMTNMSVGAVPSP